MYLPGWLVTTSVAGLLKSAALIVEYCDETGGCLEREYFSLLSSSSASTLAAFGGSFCRGLATGCPIFEEYWDFTFILREHGES